MQHLRSKQDKDELGARMKAYEHAETAKTLDARLPLYARLDGRGFSKFTKGMDRPFDKRFSDAMIETTRHLMLNTHAVAGYTQSDEISLVWKPLLDEQSNFMFDGKIQKLTSVLAGMATAKFISQLPPELQEKLPHFDCRIINMPNESEVCNMVAWREIDARKNAISMLARCHFSHQDLHKKSGTTMLKMLADKGIDFESHSPVFRNGILLLRDAIKRPMTPEELESIPEKHRPEGDVTRTVINSFDSMPYSKAPNKVEVIFKTETKELSEVI